MSVCGTAVRFLLCAMRSEPVRIGSVSLQRRRVFVNRHLTMETGPCRVDESGARRSRFCSWFLVLGAVIHDALRSVFFCHFSGFVHRNWTVAPPTDGGYFRLGLKATNALTLLSDEATPTGNESLPVMVTPTAKGSSHSVEPECIYLEPADLRPVHV